MFAEDDVNIGIFITEMLRDEGFDVTPVQNGDEAAVSLEKESFHLLLTDVRMPGIKDGIDLAAYALQKDPYLPIVIVSGYAEELGARLSKLERKVSLLRKPFRVGELISAIQSALSPALSALLIYIICVSDDFPICNL